MRETKLMVVLLVLIKTYIIQASEKNFALTLPITRIGPTNSMAFGSLKGDFNLGNQVVSADWTKWGSEKGFEEYSSREIKENPSSSLLSHGEELGFSITSFKNPAQMSGWHAGGGLGYRQMKLSWHRPSEQSEILHNSDFKLLGMTSSLRTGYRYVGQNVGIIWGLYLSYKHFQPTLNQAPQDNNILLNSEEKRLLSRRFMDGMHMGMEIGWAI
jgi:hypothetical protein